MSMLFAAKQISGTANLQIAHGNFKSGTEFREFPNSRKPFLRDFRKDFIGHKCEISIGASAAASYPPSNLMQLRKSEPVCIVDNQCIGIWHINTCFNNRCTHENINFVIYHLPPDFRKFLLAHFAVTNPDAYFRYAGFKPRCHPRNGSHIIMQPINLAAAAQFTPHSIGKDSLIVLENISLYRMPVMRRFFQYAHIPNARHGHIEGAGDRGGRKGKHIDIIAEIFQLFLLCHTKTLFFVNDYQTQITKPHIFANEPMGANDQIHFTALEFFDHFFLLFRGSKTGKQLNVYRKTLHTLQRSLIMLPCKDCRRNKQSTLFAVTDALKSCPKCNFRFSKSDISAQQTVHRCFPFHVRLNLLNTTQLVICFIKLKAAFKVALHFCIRRKCMTFCVHPRCVKFNQFLCDVLHGMPDAGFRLLPFRTAKLVQANVCIFPRTDITADQIQLRDRNIKCIAFCIPDFNIILNDAVCVNFMDTLINTDTVAFMHNIITRLQFGKGTNRAAVFITL